MGINFHVNNYDCKAAWSYSGFFSFRKKIAKHLGLTLEINPSGEWVKQNWEKWDRDWLIFLTHNDCCGNLSAYRCGRIAKKLKPILEKWSALDNDIIDTYDIDNGFLLVSAMQYCKENKKKMRFS